MTSMMNTNDLTGTQIISNKPLTVISGHECGIVSNEKWWWDVYFSQNNWWWWGFCDYVSEQIPLTMTWGKKFLLVPFHVASVQYYTKIVDTEEEITITETCNNTLIIMTFLLFPCDSKFTNAYIDPVTYCTIESDKPILVSQLVSEGRVRDSYYNFSYLHET